MNTLTATLSDWYDSNADVHSASVFEVLAESPARDTRSILIAARLIPTMDGSDVSPIWLSRIRWWRDSLEAQIGRSVEFVEHPFTRSEADRYSAGFESMRCIATFTWREMAPADPAD